MLFLEKITFPFNLYSLSLVGIIFAQSRVSATDDINQNWKYKNTKNPVSRKFLDLFNIIFA